MSAIEVVVKPVFTKAEAEWLVQRRTTLAHSAGPPEFTLVFPNPPASTSDIVRHVEAICAVTPRIRFCLRSAIIVPEMKTGWFHVFLVPDEGFGAIVRLHDRLHVGPLADCLRQDEPYIPHLTVASVERFDDARRLKASLNANELEIQGRIDELEVHERDGGAPRCVEKVALAHRGLFG